MPLPSILLRPTRHKGNALFFIGLNSQHDFEDAAAGADFADGCLSTERVCCRHKEDEIIVLARTEAGFIGKEKR